MLVKIGTFLFLLVGAASSTYAPSPKTQLGPGVSLRYMWQRFQARLDQQIQQVEILQNGKEPVRGVETGLVNVGPAACPECVIQIFVRVTARDGSQYTYPLEKIFAGSLEFLQNEDAIITRVTRKMIKIHKQGVLWQKANLLGDRHMQDAYSFTEDEQYLVDVFATDLLESLWQNHLSVRAGVQAMPTLYIHPFMSGKKKYVIVMTVEERELLRSYPVIARFPVSNLADPSLRAMEFRNVAVALARWNKEYERLGPEMLLTHFGPAPARGAFSFV